MPENDVMVVALGDPEDRRTWSGTPNHICQQLKNRHRFGGGINSDVPSGMPKYSYHGFMARLAVRRSRFRYKGIYTSYRGKYERQARAAYVQSQIQSSHAKHVIHTTSDHLPFRKKVGSTRHYSLMDTTWQSYARYSLESKGLSQGVAEDFDALYREAYAQIDHFFAIGEHVRESLTQDYGLPPEKITVVGTGAGTIRPYYGEKDYAKQMILSSAKDRLAEKGLELLIEAFKIVKQKLPDASLIVTGSKASNAKAFEVPGVAFAGFVSIEKLQELFESASLFAMPAEAEPWGLVFVEALGCRTPILGLARFAVPELCGHGKYGWAVKDATAAAVADAIVSALTAPQTLADMGIRGQEFVLGNFTWERVVDRMLNVIDSDGNR